MTDTKEAIASKPCLTPGTIWQFEASAVPFGWNRARAQFRAVMTLYPPNGRGGKPYAFPEWFNHGWLDRLTPQQIDQARDAIHAALEPIVAAWQGNPDAAFAATSWGVELQTNDPGLGDDWFGDQDCALAANHAPMPVNSNGER